MVHDLVRAVVVRIRRVVDGVVSRIVGRAVVIHRCRTVARRRDDRDRAHARAVAAKVVVRQRVDSRRTIFRHGSHIIYCVRQVVHRSYRHRNHRLVAITIEVTNLIRDHIRTVEVRIRRIVDGVVRRVIRRTAIIDRRRTVRRQGDDGDRAAHAGAVAAKVVIHQWVDVDWRILRRRLVRIIYRIREIIHWIYRNIDRRLIAIAIRITNFIDNDVSAIVIRVGRIINGIVRRIVGRAIVIHRTRTVERAADDGDRAHARAVAAEVVVDQRIDIHRRILISAYQRIINRIGQVIDRVHRDRSGCLVAIAIGITNFVVKAVRAVEVRIGRIVYRIVRRIVRRAIVVHHSRTIGRLGDYRDGAHAGAVAAKVVVGQYVDVHRRIFIGHFVRVIYCIGQVVDRINRYGDRSLVAVAAAVANLVDDQIGAVEVRIGGIVYRIVRRIVGRTIVIDHSRTIGRRGNDDDRAHAGAIAAKVVVH